MEDMKAQCIKALEKILHSDVHNKHVIEEELEKLNNDYDLFIDKHTWCTSAVGADGNNKPRSAIMHIKCPMNTQGLSNDQICRVSYNLD